MGPGDRFKIYKMHGNSWGLGIWFDEFPFDYTVNVAFIKWNIQFGFGKSYIDREEQV